MAHENYVEGCSMQRPHLLKDDGFCFWKTHFETYIKSKDIDLWQVIQNDDFVFMMDDPETKMEAETPYELLKDDENKQLGKNNEAKMTLYNALPRKECERVFMCKTAKEVWHILIITHQGNSQVKDCKIDLLTQQYEKFLISGEETIDSGFTGFNATVTSLKSLDQDYSSKNHVYEMILKNDGVASKTSKQKVKSLALKAKVTREQTSDDNDSSEEDAVIVSGTKEVKAQDKGGVATITGKKVTSLVNIQSPRRTRLLSEELGAIVKTATNRKTMQHVSWQLNLKRCSNIDVCRTFLKLCIVEDPIWDTISCKLEEPSRDIHVDEFVCCQVQHMTEENIYSLRKEMREVHASINKDPKVLTTVVEDIAKVFLQDNNEE
ncbi:hypothetical protein Tco_0796347 [Tanacetum coccineum]